MLGVVMMFDVRKGYGYIKGDDRISYNVHRKNILKPSKVLDRGENVEFTRTVNDYGYAAVNVRPM